MEYVQRLSRLFLILVIMFAVENGCNGCWEKERFALLQIKDSINFPNGTSLPSWEEDDYLDCCQWERVECHPITGRVIKLSLNYTRGWVFELPTRDWLSLDIYWHLNASVLLPFESLESLDLSSNLLRGFVGDEGLGILSNLRNLEDLDLGDNKLDNSILPSLNKLSNLKILNLAGNQLNGSISIDELDGLKNLKDLDLSSNRVASIVTANGLGKLSNLRNLEDLDLGYNQLDNSFLPSLNKLSNLKILHLASNKLNGSISIDEFDGLKNLKELDLSDNNFSSIIIANGSQGESEILNELEVLDLSYNSLNDSIWSFVGELSSIKTLYLSYNAGLHGAIRNLTNLGRIENLFMDGANILDEFLGSIRFMTSIQVLSLRGCAVDDIPSITGPSFKSLLPDLRMVLKGEENQNDMVFRTGVLQEVEFVTKGMSLPYKGTVLYLFSGINLSHNRLSGPIPHEIGNLNHIKVLNLSHNDLTGTIPATFSNLKSIESLDLSYNHLNGKIPSQLTGLNFLAIFNLSYNNLSGRMPPRVNQFGTFESDSYVGNPLLCGEPLPRNCNAAYPPPSTPRAAINGSEEDSHFMDMDVFYMSFAGSYVTVVLAIVAILFINPYWRRAWFHLVEVFLISSYYFVVDNLVCPMRGFLWK